MELETPNKNKERVRVTLKAVVLRRFAGAAADDDDLAAALDLSRPRRPEPPRGRQLLTVDALSARITQQVHVACAGDARGFNAISHELRPDTADGRGLDLLTTAYVVKSYNASVRVEYDGAAHREHVSSSTPYVHFLGATNGGTTSTRSRRGAQHRHRPTNHQPTTRRAPPTRARLSARSPIRRARRDRRSVARAAVSAGFRLDSR